MAWRKGFLRLWFFASVIWLAFWLIANQTIEKSYDFFSSSSLSTSFSREDLKLVQFKSGIAEFSVEDVSNAWIGKERWMDSPRVFEVDTAGVEPKSTDQWNKMVDSLAEVINQSGAVDNAKLRTIRNDIVAQLTIGLTVPLLLFALGAAVAWVILGFRR